VAQLILLVAVVLGLTLTWRLVQNVPLGRLIGAQTVSEIPYLIVCATVYFACWYFTAGFPVEARISGHIYLQMICSLDSIILIEEPANMCTSLRVLVYFHRPGNRGVCSQRVLCSRHEPGSDRCRHDLVLRRRHAVRVDAALLEVLALLP
jgi:hypothetical protein